MQPLRTARIKEGYGTIQRDVMCLHGLPIHAKAVYALLVSYAGQKSACFPTVVTMSRNLDICKQLVIDSIRQLEVANLVQVERNPGKGSKYYPQYILADDAPTPPPAAPAPVIPRPRRVADRNFPKEWKIPFPSRAFEEAWAKWMAYRTEIKKPYKRAQTVQSILDKLGEFDEEFSIQLIEQSMNNEYQGLVFNDTPRKYQQYLKAKGNDNDTPPSGKRLSTTF